MWLPNYQLILGRGLSAFSLTRCGANVDVLPVDMDQEAFGAGFCPQCGRPQTVGRTTAGATGNPTPFRLVGGGRARYSLGTLTRLDGTLLEGNGVVPDVAVA